MGPPPAGMGPPPGMGMPPTMPAKSVSYKLCDDPHDDFKGLTALLLPYSDDVT